jgi:hypothetical protein
MIKTELNLIFFEVIFVVVCIFEVYMNFTMIYKGF